MFTTSLAFFASSLFLSSICDMSLAHIINVMCRVVSLLSGLCCAGLTNQAWVNSQKPRADRYNHLALRLMGILYLK